MMYHFHHYRRTMQLALSGPTRHEFCSAPAIPTPAAKKLALAGVALVGASVIAVNPIAPSFPYVGIEQRAVALQLQAPLFELADDHAPRAARDEAARIGPLLEVLARAPGITEVLVVDEAHKFLGGDEADVFRRIALEARKFGPDEVWRKARHAIDAHRPGAARMFTRYLRYCVAIPRKEARARAPGLPRMGGQACAWAMLTSMDTITLSTARSDSTQGMRRWRAAPMVP